MRLKNVKEEITMELISRKMTTQGRRDVYRLPGTTNLMVYHRFKSFLIDDKGNTISRKYDKMIQFKRGLAVFTRQEKKGVVNVNGVEVLDKLYENVSLDNGIIRICEKDQWGLADSDGTIICEPKYQFIEKFTDGYARFLVKDEEKGVKLWGIISKEGKIIIEPKYFYLGTINTTRIVAQNIWGYGIIDIHENVVVPFRYERLRSNKERLLLFNSIEDNIVV